MSCSPCWTPSASADLAAAERAELITIDGRRRLAFRHPLIRWFSPPRRTPRRWASVWRQTPRHPW